MLRRNGLLCSVIVERHGDRIVVSQAASNEAIDSVLWYRSRALEYYGLSDEAILPFRVHSEALLRFRGWFQNSRLAKRTWDCCRKFRGARSKEVHARNFRSLLRVAFFEVYGGEHWMNFLLALGTINQDLVDCYNEEIDRRTPGGAHGAEPFPGPRQSARPLAAARGEDQPEVKGVQHRRSKTFEARRRRNI